MQEKSIRFSIIVPVLHEQERINGLIAHLRRLDRNDHSEIIVVDGDPARSTLRQIEERDVIGVSSPRWRSRQMNAGAAVARGDILLFLHADVLLPNDALNRILGVLEGEKHVAGAFELGIDSPLLFLRIIARLATLRSRFTRTPYGDQAIFIKKYFFHRIGGFSVIPILEDLDLMKRVKRHGGRIQIVRDRVRASARRWRKEGLVYCTVRNCLLVIFYSLGVPPERLKRFYKDHTRRDGARAAHSAEFQPEAAKPTQQEPVETL